MAAGLTVRPADLSRPGTTTVELVRAGLVLVKPKIVSLMLFTSVVAGVVTARGTPVWPVLAVLVLSAVNRPGQHHQDRHAAEGRQPGHDRRADRGRRRLAPDEQGHAHGARPARRKEA
jgi:hypothetical protein